MRLFAIAVEQSELMDNTAIQRMLEESVLPRPSSFDIKKYYAQQATYTKSVDIFDRARHLAETMRRWNRACVHIGLASGYVRHTGSSGMSLEPVSAAVVLYHTGEQAMHRLDMLAGRHLHTAHPTCQPNMPFDVLFGLQRLMLQECRALRRQPRILKSS